MKKTTFVLKVVKHGTKWAIECNRRAVELHDLKAKAVDAAFRYAKQFSPAKVRLYSAKGKMQVESNW